MLMVYVLHTRYEHSKPAAEGEEEMPPKMKFDFEVLRDTNQTRIKWTRAIYHGLLRSC